MFLSFCCLPIAVSSTAEPLLCPSIAPGPCPSIEPDTTIMNSGIWFYMFVLEAVIIVIMILSLVITIIIACCKHDSGASYSTKFPNLSRPGEKMANGIDSVDGIDIDNKLFKGIAIHGVDWADMQESHV